MKEIPLTQGKVALVDDADYVALAKRKWCYGGDGYAITWCSESKKIIKMHHVIMGRRSGLEADHINGNRIDNRRTNLRFCTCQQNLWNSRSKRGYGKLKGISWRGDVGSWRARIQVDGRAVSLGYFKNEEDAARAYDEAAREHFGEFAKCNFEKEA